MQPMMALFTILVLTGRADAGPVRQYYLSVQEQSIYSEIFDARTIFSANGREIRLYIMDGDLNRTFDHAEFRPSAAVLPTNTRVNIEDPFPVTQRLLLRSRLTEAEMRVIDEKISLGTKLDLGRDSLVVTLPDDSGDIGTLPRKLCLIATDLPGGGVINDKDFYFQKPLGEGLASCFEGIDRLNATSVVTPLVGSALFAVKPGTPLTRDQRRLKICRLLNSLGGIVIGLARSATDSKSIQEVGIIFYTKELNDLFQLNLSEPNVLDKERFLSFAAQTRSHTDVALTGDAPVPTCE